MDDDTSAQLGEEWLTPPELAERSQHKECAACLRLSVEPFVTSPIPGINPIPGIDPTIWLESPKLEEPSTNRRSSRLAGYSRHPIRGKDPLPSKVMDLIEVIPVPSTAPAAKPATIQSRDDIEPRNEPR